MCLVPGPAKPSVGADIQVIIPLYFVHIIKMFVENSFAVIIFGL